jgi:hypothetical protein
MSVSVLTRAYGNNRSGANEHPTSSVSVQVNLGRGLFIRTMPAHQAVAVALGETISIRYFCSAPLRELPLRVLMGRPGVLMRQSTMTVSGC